VATGGVVFGGLSVLFTAALLVQGVWVARPSEAAGVLSVLAIGWFALAAIIAGIVAAANGASKGAAGVILGVICLVLWGLFALHIARG
jgi:hypothetical protein